MKFNPENNVRNSNNIKLWCQTYKSCSGPPFFSRPLHLLWSWSLEKLCSQFEHLTLDFVQLIRCSARWWEKIRRLQLEQGCLRRRLEGIEPGNGKGGGRSRDRSRDRGSVAGSRVGRGVAGRVAGSRVWSRGRGFGRGVAGLVAGSRVGSQFGTDLLLSEPIWAEWCKVPRYYNNSQGKAAVKEGLRSKITSGWYLLWHNQ